MFYMSKRLKILGWRLNIYAKSCVEGSMIGEIQHPHQVKDQMKDQMKIEIVPIDKGEGLLPVNLFLRLHI